ncbi:hypothetical protein C8J57DRAFT_1514642 [Mycena rebaudengoi]|nr:hypothetical protein C8J57DRAFT_1514642 [Mycena rebaudengoi]
MILGGARQSDFIKGHGASRSRRILADILRGGNERAHLIKRPLYVIGGSDLGTKAAADLDAALERVFDVATAWKAIVLVDEADLFLERHSLHDLERNAMVAVFLRHVEYYRGILFLTTNRVQAFDEAFLSRIHVTLHFRELSEPSKAQVWRAFLAKAGVAEVSAAQISLLAQRDVDVRQIKNATLDAMDEFTEQFEGMKAVMAAESSA